MQNIRIDDQGRQRCWNCGGLHFTHKRTARAKVIGGAAGVATLGVAGAAAPLVTKKKLKCQSCGQYNDVGASKPYRGPASRRAAKKAGTAAVDGPDFRTEFETLREESRERKAKRLERREAKQLARAEQADAAAHVERAAELPPFAAPPQTQLPPSFTGVTGDAEVVEAEEVAPASPPPPEVPATWHLDPFGRHELRYWDGHRWTQHVSDQGAMGVDEPT